MVSPLYVCLVPPGLQLWRHSSEQRIRDPGSALLPETCLAQQALCGQKPFRRVSIVAGQVRGRDAEVNTMGEPGMGTANSETKP